MIIIFLMFVLLCHAMPLLPYCIIIIPPATLCTYLPLLRIHKLASLFLTFHFYPMTFYSTFTISHHILSSSIHRRTISCKWDRPPADQTRPETVMIIIIICCCHTVWMCVKNGWMNAAAVAWRKSLKVEWTTSELVEVQWRKGSNNLMLSFIVTFHIMYVFQFTWSTHKAFS